MTMIEELKALAERAVSQDELHDMGFHATAEIIANLPAIISALSAVPVMKEALTEARGIIEQIGPDFRYPPAPDSVERRVQRANRWLEAADNILEGTQ
jgi:hypothetical protein